MEILQTIWTALTSENIELVKIIGIPMTVLEISITLLLFTTILNITSTRAMKYTYIIIFSLISIICSLFIPTPYNTFINLIACPLLIYFILKTNILKAILAEIIPYIIFIIIGAITTNIYLSVLNTSLYVVSSTPIYRIGYLIILYFFAFLLYKLCKYCNLNIYVFENMNKRSNIRLLLNLLVGIIVIAIQSYILGVYTDTIPLIVVVSTLVSLLVYFFISIYSLSRTNKLEITTQNLEEEKLYNKTLTILHDSIRGFKHDFNNIVQAIGGYVTTEDMVGLKKYYSELLDDCQKVNNLSVLNPEVINNPAIYSLLTAKYHLADELGIKINLEIFLDLNTINIKIYELTRILGILLDNSIEASKNCEEKIINIIFRNDKTRNRQLIIIENTYNNKEVNTEEIFEKGYTSKTDDNKNHGLGLWEVRQILSKNNNLNLFTTKDETLFKQQLEIYIYN